MSGTVLELIVAACFLLYIAVTAVDVRRHRRNGGDQ